MKSEILCLKFGRIRYWSNLLQTETGRICTSPCLNPKHIHKSLIEDPIGTLQLWSILPHPLPSSSGVYRTSFKVALLKFGLSGFISSCPAQARSIIPHSKLSSSNLVYQASFQVAFLKFGLSGLIPSCPPQAWSIRAHSKLPSSSLVYQASFQVALLKFGLSYLIPSCFPQAWFIIVKIGLSYIIPSCPPQTWSIISILTLVTLLCHLHILPLPRRQTSSSMPLPLSHFPYNLPPYPPHPLPRRQTPSSMPLPPIPSHISVTTFPLPSSPPCPEGKLLPLCPFPLCPHPFPLPPAPYPPHPLPRRQTPSSMPIPLIPLPISLTTCLLPSWGIYDSVLVYLNLAHPLPVYKHHFTGHMSDLVSSRHVWHVYSELWACIRWESCYVLTTRLNLPL